MNVHRRAALALSLSALALAPAAHAAPKEIAYEGQTKEGTSVKFRVADGWLKRLMINAPTTCVSAQRGTPRVYIPMFWPGFKWRVGYSGTVEEKDPTRHYTLVTKRRGDRISGKFSVSYSMLGSDSLGWKIDTCSGSASFSLRPKVQR